MNNNIKLLVNLLYLKENLLSDLEDDDKDDDSDFIYEYNTIKTFNGKPTASYMNKYNGIGHFLIYQKNNTFQIVKRYNENINDKLIGICVGKGLWMSTEFNYEGWMYNALLVKRYEIPQLDGWNTTKYIWENTIRDGIWDELYDQIVSGLGNKICYLPDVKQLQEIYQNNNILQLPYDRVWSCKQYEKSWAKEYCLNMETGKVEVRRKEDDMDGIALIHFD